MRVAVLSDIHGNLRALDACLADLEREGGASEIVVAGDLCMDGPRGREVLERLASIGARCVRGNTDRYIAEPESERFDEREAAAIAWQRAALGTALVERLRALPFSLRLGEGADAALVVHANPVSDDDHLRPDADDDRLAAAFAGVTERTLVFGHLHVPYVRSWRDRTLVCVASAGLPKDGDPRAAYTILTARPGGWQLRSRRVDFDVARCVRDIERSGMPDAAKRIRVLRKHRYNDLHGLVT